MASHREHKRNGRRQLHQRLAVPAVYVAPDSTQTECSVRLHTIFPAIGGDIENGYQYGAERFDQTPRLVFLISEVPSPARGGIVSVEAGEAYRIDSIREPDDITVTANVIRLTGEDTAGLPLPGVL